MVQRIPYLQVSQNDTISFKSASPTRTYHKSSEVEQNFSFKLTRFISPDEFYIIKETPKNVDFLSKIRDYSQTSQNEITTSDDLSPDEYYLYNGKRCRIIPRDSKYITIHLIDYNTIKFVREHAIFQLLPVELKL